MNDLSPSPETETAPQLPVLGRTSMPIPQQMSVEDAVVERVLRQPDINVDIVKDVLDLRRQLYEQRRLERAEEARIDFFENLAKVQNEIKRVVTDKENTHTRSKYASYAALDRALRPIYTKYGFSVTWNTLPTDTADYVIETGKLSRGGHTEDYQSPRLRADGKGPKGDNVMTQIHAAGSAKTYGRRYLLIDMFNVAITNDPNDDDGNAAGGYNSGRALNDKQIETLYTLIEESNTDIEKFLKWGGVETVEELPPNKYSAAVAFLNRRKAENSAAAEAKPAEQKKATENKKKPLELP